MELGWLVGTEAVQEHLYNYAVRPCHLLGFVELGFFGHCRGPVSIDQCPDLKTEVKSRMQAAAVSYASPSPRCLVFSCEKDVFQHVPRFFLWLCGLGRWPALHPPRRRSSGAYSAWCAGFRIRSSSRERCLVPTLHPEP